MLFSLRHQLSGQALTDLVKVIRSLLPDGHTFVASAYLLKKYFADFFGEPAPKKHFYCGNCLGRMKNDQTQCSKEKCRNAKKKIEYFLELDLHLRLCQLFRDSEFVRLLGYRFENNFYTDDDIRDIYSGQEYRKLMHPGGFLSKDNPFNRSFSFNTDGVSPFKSSNRQNFWPIFLVINELPPRLRYSRRYMFLAGLWCSKKKPNMQTFCRPIVESINGLYHNGLTVVTPNGKEKLLRATLLLSSADLPAKSRVSNMKQFNGEKGCSVCEDEGKTAGSGGLHRIWPYTTNMVLRTHKSVVESVRKVTQSGKPVNGIKGASVFLLFKPFDLVKGFVVEWMPSVCLGVSKSLMNLWPNTENRESEFFLGSKIAVLNKRLLCIKVPDVITRCPRSLADRATWKATEYRNWLLHYSVPVLKGVLPSQHFLHYTMLVTAVAFLVSDRITMDQLKLADELLDNFCKLMPELYGEGSQTHNFHLLRHLTFFVQLFGPLWVYSCFRFEALNGFLATMIHGTQHISSQIASAVSIYRNFPMLISKMKTTVSSETVVSLAKQLSGERSLPTPPGDKQQAFVLGTSKNEVPIKQEMLAANRFLSCRSLEVFAEGDRVETYRRAFINGSFFSCAKMCTSKLKNSYTVQYTDASGRIQFGEIQKFFLIKTHHVAIVTKLVQIRSLASGVTSSSDEFNEFCNSRPLLHHMAVTRRSPYLFCVPLSQIERKLVVVSSLGDNMLTVSTFPNIVQHD
ncbi:uncharacterized protein [Porites lutea]|uniref:uncharacterized protein n=1 Tax=Porites lutea TaxID=51062 RepID=UPI003CC60D56